jgi:hypothetical protein
MAPGSSNHVTSLRNASSGRRRAWLADQHLGLSQLCWGRWLQRSIKVRTSDIRDPVKRDLIQAQEEFNASGQARRSRWAQMRLLLPPPGPGPRPAGQTLAKRACAFDCSMTFTVTGRLSRCVCSGHHPQRVVCAPAADAGGSRGSHHWPWRPARQQRQRVRQLQLPQQRQQPRACQRCVRVRAGRPTDRDHPIPACRHWRAL